MSNRMAGWAAAILLGAFFSGGSAVAAADEFSPVGRWLLTNDWGGPWEIMLFDVAQGGEGYEISVVDTRPNFGALTQKRFEYKEGRLSLDFRGDRFQRIQFEGELKRSGPHKGEFLGTVRPGMYLNPGRLTRTNAEKRRAEPAPPFDGFVELLQKAAKAEDADDLKGATAIYADVFRRSPGPGTVFQLRQWFVLAETVGASEEQVREQIKTWLAAAEPYGQEFVEFARLVALRSLREQPTFAQASLELAEQARKHLSDLHSLDNRSSVLRFLARAAVLTGRNELAADAERQAAEIDARLDADYDARVPPFEVEPFAGRERGDDDCVVLVELFTAVLSAAPGLAPQIAFDAVGSSFEPGEVILLQYHVHQNGADALANPDTIARAEYYGVRGVPMCYFNGDVSSGAAGPMELAADNYRDFRWQVVQQLRGKNAADVKLNVTRSADKLLIQAIARAAEVQRKSEPIGEKANGQPGLRLRLALTEKLVRFDGGNGARMNRRVVRDFPGGVEGQPLVDGKAYVRLELELGEVRRDINEYLGSQSQFIALSSLRPAAPLALENVAVVAFVQDDATKRVLHAVQVDAPEKSAAAPAPSGRGP